MAIRSCDTKIISTDNLVRWAKTETDMKIETIYLYETTYKLAGKNLNEVLLSFLEDEIWF